MKKRYFAHYVLMAVGLLLILGTAAGACWYLALDGLFGDSWRKFTDATTNAAVRWMVDNEEFLKTIGAAVGALFTLGSGAAALLKSWHYAEANLPSRLVDYVAEQEEAHARSELIARGRLDFSDSTFLDGSVDKTTADRLRATISGPKSEARLFALSKDKLSKEVDVIESAAREAKARLATCHLIRGLFHASQDDHEKAFQEFDGAARARPDDIEVLDIAAACARRLREEGREHQLLLALQEQARLQGKNLLQAKAVRRRAELLFVTQLPANLEEARDTLEEADELLGSLTADDEVKLEIGRNRCLFCEVQVKRRAIGHLGPQLARAEELLRGVRVSTATGEEGGRPYGEATFTGIRARIARRSTE